MDNDYALWQLAEKSAKERLGFQVHFAAYIVASAFFVVMWYVSSGYDTSFFPWFIIPIAGWGIGIIGHFVAAYLGGSHRLAIAEREYRRLKGGN